MIGISIQHSGVRGDMLAASLFNEHYSLTLAVPSGCGWESLWNPIVLENHNVGSHSL